MKIVIFRNIYHNLYYTQNNQILSFKYEKKKIVTNGIKLR